MNALRHLPARTLTTEHLGQRVTVRGLAATDEQMSAIAWRTVWREETVAGGLSDYDTHETAGRVELWVGGRRMDVHADTTITIGQLDVPGGA